MAGVAVKNGNLDNAIKRWKQKSSRDGIPSEMRKREAYTKPGVKRRQVKQEGIKNARRKARRER